MTSPKNKSAASKPSDADLVTAAMLSPDLFANRPLVDIGLNLADCMFNHDRADVLERAHSAGVAACVLTGTCLRSTRAAQELCREPSPVALYYTCGVHPHHAKEWTQGTTDQLRTLAKNPLCCAVGECGLDFNRNYSSQGDQRHAFVEQLKLARELQKPVFLHNRDGGEEFLRILRMHNSGPDAVKVCVHCFTGSAEELQELLELDAYIGITGWICDDRPERGAEALSKLLPRIPSDRLMIETDAPYLTPRCVKPSKARPRRNEPALLGRVLQRVAVCLDKPCDIVASETTAVAQDFFSLPEQAKQACSGRAASSL